MNPSSSSSTTFSFSAGRSVRPNHGNQRNQSHSSADTLSMERSLRSRSAPLLLPHDHSLPMTKTASLPVNVVTTSKARSESARAKPANLFLHRSTSCIARLERRDFINNSSRITVQPIVRLGRILPVAAAYAATTWWRGRCGSIAYHRNVECKIQTDIFPTRSDSLSALRSIAAMSLYHRSSMNCDRVWLASDNTCSGGDLRARSVTHRFRHRFNSIRFSASLAGSGSVH